MTNIVDISVSALAGGLAAFVYSLVRDRNRQQLDIERDVKLSSLQKDVSEFTTRFSTKHTRFFNEKADTMKALYAGISGLSSNVKLYLIYLSPPLSAGSELAGEKYWAAIDNTNKRIEEGLRIVQDVTPNANLYLDSETHDLFMRIYTEIIKAYGLLHLGTGKHHPPSAPASIKSASEILLGTLPPAEKEFEERMRVFFATDTPDMNGVIS